MNQSSASWTGPDLLSACRYVRVSRFVLLTGYTSKAVYHKIADGVWTEGREYRRAPDGNICIDIKGFESWVEGNRVLASSR